MFVSFLAFPVFPCIQSQSGWTPGSFLKCDLVALLLINCDYVSSGILHYSFIIVSHTGFGPSIMSLTGADCCYSWVVVFGQVSHTETLWYNITVRLIIPQHCSQGHFVFPKTFDFWSFPKVIHKYPNLPLGSLKVAGPSPGQLTNSLSFSRVNQRWQIFHSS